MKVLVTGAHGFLGRTLLGLENGLEWIGCGRRAESVAGSAYFRVDLEDRRAAGALLERVRPDWVINAAALTDVDRCETEREQARRTNVGIVEHLVEACRHVGAGLVQLSTDYVFDGESGPYGEEDQPRPLSYYGALKLESERLVLEGLDQGLVVRTLWLYGYVPQARPNFVTRALEHLSRGQPLRVFADQWGNPTYVDDLAGALVELCRRAASGLFHVGGATFMTRHELALELSHFFGLDSRRVEPVATRSAGLKAVRPLRSGLRTAALEAELGRRPLSFKQGLEQLVRQAAFCRDFAHLIH